MFLQQDEQQQPEQMVYPDQPLKPYVLPTYATQSFTPTNFNPAQNFSFQKPMFCPKTSVDISFQQQIFKDNAELIKSAVLLYLKECLGQKFYEIRGVLAKNILNSNQSVDYEEQEFIQEFITSKNKLLSGETQNKLFNYIGQFQQIGSLFKQLKQLLGSTLNRQFTFITANILILKLDSFKKLKNKQIFELIPQMQRFWGDQGQEKFLSNGWYLYEDIDYSQIKKFSVEKIDQMASRLYYAPELQYLNLSQVKISRIQASDKFCALICLFSETLFLTISGMRQRHQDLQEFLQQLKMDLSLGQIKHDHPSKRAKIE